MEEREIFDITIIGAGPTGLEAALAAIDAQRNRILKQILAARGEAVSQTTAPQRARPTMMT